MTFKAYTDAVAAPTSTPAPLATTWRPAAAGCSRYGGGDGTKVAYSPTGWLRLEAPRTKPRSSDPDRLRRRGD